MFVSMPWDLEWEGRAAGLGETIPFWILDLFNSSSKLSFVFFGG